MPVSVLAVLGACGPCSWQTKKYTTPEYIRSGTIIGMQGPARSDALLGVGFCDNSSNDARSVSGTSAWLPYANAEWILSGFLGRGFAIPGSGLRDGRSGTMVRGLTDRRCHRPRK